MDNVFIERLWRSLKHEDIYLKGYAEDREANAGIASCYNSRRHIRRLANRAPIAVWCEGTAGPLGGAAVDMMDNEEDWPTSPQPKQQQQTFAMIKRCARS